MMFVSFDGGSKLGSVFVTAMLVLFRLEAAWLPRVETPHISGIQPTLKEVCHKIQPNWVITGAHQFARLLVTINAR